jgi:tRNA A37 threonylcarbamoyladenosine biosynthesis protein TsaE
MEALGNLLHGLCIPGTVVLLSGHLGSGKTAIARGIVRAFCQDPDMFVPSPTFLLNLSYQEDTAHEAGQGPAAATAPAAAAAAAAATAPAAAAAAAAATAPAAAAAATAAAANVGCAGSQQQDPAEAAEAPNPGSIEQQQQQQQQLWRPGSSIHHMDPYRLGTADKMAGLLDFESAFLADVCVIEWPSKMPSSVMNLPRR